ncbi:MAG: F0F1 ATP synthase subunit alpha [Candidatus Wildermuthbacteria bacterium]|nr:F0F1 ATP synthase subunit alpha [Candidatus Wildermuthbacteria bacterium]
MGKIEQFKKQLEKMELEPKVEEIGEAIEVKDGVVKASGLASVENFELVKFEGKDVQGLVLNLEEDETGIVILGNAQSIKEGDIIKRTKKTLSVPVGPALLGRVVDSLGRPIDGKGEILTKDFLPVERMGPSVIEREPVNTPLHTGILAIDSLIPIGRGQRELILGDRGIGKTALAIDTILNQKGEKNRPTCVYVACGQKKSKIKRLINVLEKAGAMEYTVVVCAFADDPASFLFLAPYVGTTIGEYFRDKGQDALIIFDDLTKQSWAWREISLILRRPPGREAYPGDIFYLHSRLLERAAKLSKEKGGGSLTALPIIETQAGDISAYIPTNVISITDGQIFLDTPLFSRGQRPAIDIGKSVSRVGSKAQLKVTKKLSGTLKLDLAQFQELERFSEFTEELDPETKKIIEKGKRMREVLKQQDSLPLSFDREAVIMFASVMGHLDDLEITDIQDFKQNLIKEIERMAPEIFKAIREKEDIDEATQKKLEEVILKVKKIK